MLVNTRTTQRNFIVRALAWNMPYHTAHHLFPAVPFFALGKLNAEIRDRIRAVGSGYFAFHRDFVARLRRKGLKAS
jgi:fatty acid desaturase